MRPSYSLRRGHATGTSRREAAASTGACRAEGLDYRGRLFALGEALLAQHMCSHDTSIEGIGTGIGSVCTSSNRTRRQPRQWRPFFGHGHRRAGGQRCSERAEALGRVDESRAAHKGHMRTSTRLQPAALKFRHMHGPWSNPEAGYNIYFAGVPSLVGESLRAATCWSPN